MTFRRSKVNPTYVALVVHFKQLYELCVTLSEAKGLA